MPAPQSNASKAMKLRVKALSASLRRNWASWVALSICVLVVVTLAVAAVRISQRQPTIDWISDQGGKVSIEPGWLSTQTPPGVRSWLDKTLGSEWSKPFDTVAYVDLENVHLEDKDFGRLKNFRELEALSLKNLPETGLSDLKSLSRLESLYLWRSDAGDDQIRDLSRFSKMENFYGTARMTDRTLVSLGKLPRLRILYLHGSRITDEGLANLGGLSELREMTLDKTELDGSGFVHLKGLTKLESLCLRSTNMTDAGAEHLRVHWKLSYLALRNTKITDTGLKHLGGLSNLRDLFLEGTSITGAGLEHLQGLNELRRLDLDDTRVSDAGLLYLQSLSPTLNSLALSHTNITDVGLKHLQGLSKLGALRLSGTRITDEGLRQLRGFSELSYLFLNETNITDEGLEHLMDLPKLHHVWVEETRVTGAGVERLESAISGNHWDPKVKWTGPKEPAARVEGETR